MANHRVPEGATTSAAERVVPLHVAVITTEVEPRTGAVVTMKLTAVAPAGTVMVAGIATTPGLALERATTAPPSARSGPPRMRGAVAPPPPVTVSGATVSAATVPGCPVGGRTSSLAVAIPAAEAAVRKTGMDAAIGVVVTLKGIALLPGRI